MERTDLDLWAVILLDKVQKGIRIDHKEHQQLKNFGLVEGRYPNLYLSAGVAAATDQKVKHIRDGGLDRQFYKNLIVELVRQHGPVTRQEIDQLLLDKLPEALLPQQKVTRIHNLLTALRLEARIRNIGSKRFPCWVLNNKKQ